MSPDRLLLSWRPALRRWFLGLTLFVGAAQPVAAQFAIDELELHITADGSGAQTRVIPIRSNSDSVQQIRVTLSDWERDSVGGNLFLPFGTHASSCNGRVEVFPLTLQLGPGATEFVRVTFRGTDTADPGCWAVILTEAVRPPSSRSEGAAVSITTVMGVKLYVHARNAQAQGDVVSADVESFWVPAASGDSVLARDVAVRFANTGGAHLRVRSSVEIRNEATQVVARLDGPEAYITPQAFRDILIRLPSIPRGRYIAVVLLDFGADELTAAQVEFEIP